MSVFLTGPFPFDAATVLASGRAALGAVGSAIREGRVDQLPVDTRLDQPGLYVLLREPGPAIAGLWIVFGQHFLDDGPPGPPERVPPYASALLEAATEEVWWKNLRVTDDGQGSWRPVIVLDWPPPLAVRSVAAPPGVATPAERPAGGGDGGEEGWLESRLLGADARREAVVVEEEAAERDPYAGLPEARGLVTVIQGHLHFTRALHTGAWRLVPPSALGDGSPVPLERWLEAATQATESGPVLEESEAGPPLALPGGRVAFPLQGWLTRALEPWPERPEDVLAGALAAREVQTKWKGQVVRALTSMVAVLIGVGGLAAGVRLAAEPRPQPLAVTPTPAPQPAMSVCSADHQAFVDELRCQVAALSSSSETFLTDPVCGDAGTPAAVPADDLQAAYCGLLDRAIDGWTGNRVEREQTYNFAHLALAQACFNVLGRPYPYTQSGGFQGGRPVADPARFLEDPDLGIASLVEAASQLQAACDLYRGRVEARVEGAVFATHIGAPAAAQASPGEPEPSALRRRAMATAVAGLGADATRCFETGAREGTSIASYADLCGPSDPADERLGAVKIWRKLGAAGASAGDVVARYAAARFGLAEEAAPAKTDSGLWRCHLALTGELAGPARSSVDSLWDLELPVPASYELRGAGAKSQLVLDAGMLAFEGGLDAGVCWDLVRRRLNAYERAHPLLGPLAEGGWPSVEQRLCGQVCASTFRVASGPGRAAWLTPEADLARCVSTSPPADPPDLGAGGLDRLRIPWSGERWREPTAAQVCAFNLVAQGYFQGGDEGYIVGGRSPVQWAGETAPGSRIAGGAEGLAADAIAGMQRYGTGSGWSVGRCGYVATQCFSELLLEITGDSRSERYEWLPRWRSAVSSLAGERAAVLAEKHPWCAPLQPYLVDEADMAQFDTPCRRGVEMARQNVERAARAIAAGSGAAVAKEGP